MAKTRVVHACNECGTPHPKWAGQCSGCGAWNTLVEEVAAPVRDRRAPSRHSLPSAPVLIGDVDTQVGRPQPTGIGELDRVLGGGIVAGSVTLLGGEPGIGKSTLLLQLLAWWPATTLYVSAEESAQQVRLRAERLGAVRPDLWLLAATAVPDIVAAIDEIRPDLVVVDSIQAVADPVLGSPPGSVVQVRACAHRLVVEAKRRGIPVVHGRSRHQGRRPRRAARPRARGRHGAVVRGRPAPLVAAAARHEAPVRSDRRARVVRDGRRRSGRCARPERAVPRRPPHRRARVGRRARRWRASARSSSRCKRSPRPRRTTSPSRRTSQGIDGGRLALLLAVLQQRARQPVGNADVYASTVGGVRLVEPGLDLAVCMAVVSALTGQPMPADLAVFGEVGLGGELRQVGHTRRRLTEAARLGFARAIVPGNSPNGVEGIRMIRVVHAVGGAGAGRNGRRRHAATDGKGSQPVVFRHAGPVQRCQRADAQRARSGGAGHAAARRHRPRRAGQGGRAARVVATSATCWRSARAASSSTRRTARSGCRSWRRWTARSSSRPTATASPGPTSTSSPIRPCPPPRRAPATAPPSASPGRSTCRSSAPARRWASSTSTPAARSTSCRRSAACSTGPTRRCRRSSATRCASTTRSPT